MLPAMHPVVELDYIELCAVQDQFDFFEQHRVGHKARGGEAGHEGIPSETLFHFRIVVARDGIADEQDAREIAFVRMRDPDVAPLDGFAGGRRGVRFSDRNAACKSSRQAKRGDQIEYYLHNGDRIGYGGFEFSFGVDPAWMSFVASSSETRAMTQATHDSPRSSAPFSGEYAGANVSPLPSAASASFFWPSCECAIATMA